MIDLLFSVGVRRQLTGVVGVLTSVLAAALAVWVVYAAIFAIIDPWELTAVFLAAMYGLVFVAIGARPGSDPTRPSPADWVLSVLCIAAGVHFFLNSDAIVSRIPLLDPLTNADVVFGTVLFLATVEVTRRTTGLGLTVIVILFIAYNFLGQFIGGTAGHGAISYLRFLELVVYTTEGILGVPVRVAATYAFMFVMFGTFLARAGGSAFFYNIAAVISGRRIGGPAKIAVISSGLYGMLSGSPTADVVTTGAVTIPMMKKHGYSGALAGAFEVAASTGGSILPPVMGSAAFIMAEFSGIEYVDIAIAAVLPAILYYIAVYAQVHLRSARLGLTGLAEQDIPRLGPTLREGGIFIVPLIVLMVALLMGYSPNMVAVFGALAVLAVGALRRSTRLGPVATYRSLVETTTRMMSVTGACAAAGLVIAGFTMTGLSMKFGALVGMISGDDLFTALIIVAGITILLGMGMPTPSAYVLAAALVGPLLTRQLGISVMAAHMFLLYFACMSALTPPVAVAAYAAAPLADANPLHIAALASRLAIAAFVVPFSFVFNEALLLKGSVFDISFAFASTAIGLIMLAVAIEGYIRTAVPWWWRLGFAVAGVLLVIPSVDTTLVGLVMAAVIVGARRATMRAERRIAT